MDKTCQIPFGDSTIKIDASNTRGDDFVGHILGNFCSSRELQDWLSVAREMNIPVTQIDIMEMDTLKSDFYSPVISRISFVAHVAVPGGSLTYPSQHVLPMVMIFPIVTVSSKSYLLTCRRKEMVQGPLELVSFIRPSHADLIGEQARELIAKVSGVTTQSACWVNLSSDVDGKLRIPLTDQEIGGESIIALHTSFTLTQEEASRLKEASTFLDDVPFRLDLTEIPYNSKLGWHKAIKDIRPLFGSARAKIGLWLLADYKAGLVVNRGRK